MNDAAARAASRRGSSMMIRPSPRQVASSSASGTRVVLPAPGGATSTARALLQHSPQFRQNSIDREEAAIYALFSAIDAGRKSAATSWEGKS